MMPYTAAMKDARLELRIERKLMARIDAARGDVSRTRWVERALESALSEAKGPSLPMRAGPGPVSSSEGVRPAAPSRAPKKERLTEAQSVKAQADWMMERQRKLNEKKS
jgi:hypothetical protein